jgi:hypothetical protein
MRLQRRELQQPVLGERRAHNEYPSLSWGYAGELGKAKKDEAAG